MSSQIRVKLSCESFCYFRVGDIITRDPRTPKVDFGWCHKEVRITGFSPNLLWGADENERIRWTDELNGLLLLARPGWRYRAGERVSFCKNKKSGNGSIIMLNPNNDSLDSERYLVDVNFKEGPLLKAVAGVILGEDLWIPIYRRNRTFANCLLLKEEEIIGKWHC